jgi:hypothetical protein
MPQREGDLMSRRGLSGGSRPGGAAHMISEEELKQIRLFQSVDLESIKGLIDA